MNRGCDGAEPKVGFRPSLEAAFDDGLPPELRRVSENHWTPVEVVRLGARWLVQEGARQVLDVGSGVGKFCTLAALETKLECVGLEQRSQLVRVAREAAARLGATRAHFVVGGLERLGELSAEALYLYNPFVENITEPSMEIDGSVEMSPWRYRRHVRAIREHLQRAVVGQLVLTFHGFGCRMPRGYRELRAQPAGTDFLRLYRKVESGSA